MKRLKACGWLFILTIALLCGASADKQNYYCEYCGQKFASVSSLTSGRCQRHPSLTSGRCQKHPNGYFKGRHAPAL